MLQQQPSFRLFRQAGTSTAPTLQQFSNQQQPISLACARARSLSAVPTNQLSLAVSLFLFSSSVRASPRSTISAVSSKRRKPLTSGDQAAPLGRPRYSFQSSGSRQGSLKGLFKGVFKGLSVSLATSGHLRGSGASRS